VIAVASAVTRGGILGRFQYPSQCSALKVDALCGHLTSSPSRNLATGTPLLISGGYG
jgi:hypothetical protein